MNTIGKWVTTATIHDGPRRYLWSEVFPGAVIPIKSIIPSKAHLPGHPNADVYMLDLDAITDDQREGLIRVLSVHFDIPIDEVRSEINLGVPILAESVSASTTDQGFVFSLMDDPFEDIREESSEHGDGFIYEFEDSADELGEAFKEEDCS